MTEIWMLVMFLYIGPVSNDNLAGSIGKPIEGSYETCLAEGERLKKINEATKDGFKFICTPPVRPHKRIIEL